MAPGALLHPLPQPPGKLSPFREIESGGGGNRTRRRAVRNSLHVPQVPATRATWLEPVAFKDTLLLQLLPCVHQTVVGPPHEGIEQTFLDTVGFPNRRWLKPNTLLGGRLS